MVFIFIFFRFLATRSSYRTLAFSFRMGRPTVASIIEETIEAIWCELQPTYMPIPTEPSLRSVADDFLKIWNFPNCGRHRRKTCSNHMSWWHWVQWVNVLQLQKKYFSTVLQGVADAKYRFINIEVGGGNKVMAEHFKHLSCTMLWKMEK